MKQFPFIFIGHGDYFDYSLTCYVKFKTEISEEQKQKLIKIIPKNFEEVQWIGPVLKFHDNCIGGSVKSSYEPDWWEKVDIEEAMDKDLELYERPTKNTWEKFGNDFNGWVEKLNTVLPIDFFIKGWKVPKAKVTPWNQWSIGQIEKHILPFIDKQLDASRENNTIYENSLLLNTVVNHLFITEPPKSMSKELKERIMNIYPKTNSYLPGYCYGDIFFSLPVEEQHKKLDLFCITPSLLLLNAIKDSDKSEEFLADDKRFGRAFEILKDLEPKFDTLCRDLENSAVSITLIHQLSLGKGYLSMVKIKNSLRAARLMDLAILLSEAHDGGPDVVAKESYIHGSVLYFLAKNSEKALEIAQKGFTRFSGNIEFIRLFTTYAEAAGSDMLLNACREAESRFIQRKPSNLAELTEQSNMLINRGEVNKAQELLLNHFHDGGEFDLLLFQNLFYSFVVYHYPPKEICEKAFHSSILTFYKNTDHTNAAGFLINLAVCQTHVEKYNQTIELLRKCIGLGIELNCVLLCYYTLSAAKLGDRAIMKEVADHTAGIYNTKPSVFTSDNKNIHFTLGNTAGLYALLGDKEKMLALLKATRKYHPHFASLKADSDFKEFWNDADFLKLFE